MANYDLGANTERVLIAHAHHLGCEAVRAAGSKGPCDVLVFAAPKTRIARPYAVNVKRNRWAPARECEAMRQWLAFGVIPVLARADVGRGHETVWRFRVGTPGGFEAASPWAPWAG